MDYIKMNVFIVIVVFRLHAAVVGYSSGAPWQIVLSPSPKHGTQRQTSPCPFSLYLNQNRYQPGDTIHLTLRSKTNDRMLKGIQIRARPKLGDPENVLGQFVSWPENKTQPISVFGGQNNCITHWNNLPVPSVELMWTAPNVSVGDIIFEVTFLEDFEMYWVFQEFLLTATEQISYPEVEQLSPSFELVDWSACGETKGCFLYPRTCTGYDCYAAVTYKTINQTVEFEMFGSKTGYISLALSHDKYMGDDETISCTADETTDDMRVGIQRGRNHKELYNERQLKAGIMHIQGTYSDGKLYCRFTRPLEMSLYIGKGHTTTLTYDLRDDFYIMLAWGSILHGTAVMKRHLELPPISESKVDLQEYVITRGTSLPLAKQIHGGLMLFAWILLVGIVTIISRYFKNGFNGKSVCGTKLWFQLHRFLAVLAWVFTAASFILIFVTIGGLNVIELTTKDRCEVSHRVTSCFCKHPDTCSCFTPTSARFPDHTLNERASSDLSVKGVAATQTSTIDDQTPPINPDNIAVTDTPVSIPSSSADQYQDHRNLGITVMVAVTLQVLGGLVRPNNKSNLRPVFNIIHWLLGKTTHILAAVTFFFAFNQDWIPTPQKRFAYIIIGVWLGLQVCWEMGFEIHARCTPKGKSKYSVKSKDVDEETSPPDIALWLYVLCLVALATAALAAVFIF